MENEVSEIIIPESIEKRIIKIIKAQRKLKKISQEEMAEFIGISRSQYGHIESGRCKLNVVNLVGVCSAMNIKVLLVDGNNILN